MKLRRIRKTHQRRLRAGSRTRWFIQACYRFMRPVTPFSVENFYSSEPMPGLSVLKLSSIVAGNPAA